MSENETSSNINNLQEALIQQQQKIAALREMVRKSDNTHQNKLTGGASTTDKVRDINKKLNQLKAKAKGGHYSGGGSGGGGGGVDELNISAAEMTSEENDFSSMNVVAEQLQSSAPPVALSSGSEKVLLLRQQMEQNKLRLAQRASSKLHLEQLVSELKEKMDSTQQCLDDTTELGKSMTDLSMYATLTRSNTSSQSTAAAGCISNTTTPTATRREQRHRSATDLSSQQGFNLEKERIKFLENRCRLLEKQLEKEKQAASCAAAQLEATKQAELESNEQLKRNKELENRILELEQSLQAKEQEIETKNEENAHLQNELLRTSNVENVDELRNLELERLRQENSNLKARLHELEDINAVLETTRTELAASNAEYREKLQEMENQLRESEKSMESLNVQLKEQENSAVETATESLSTSLVEDTESRVCLEMAKQIQELQNTNENLKTENDELKQTIAASEKLEVNDEQINAKITSLEATIESQREDLTSRQVATTKIEEELMEKTIELNVLNANFRVLEEKLQTLNKTKNKALFSNTGSESAHEDNADLQAENQQIKQKLDESNKAMIKLKLKCKQTEKEVEKLKKTSKLHEEFIELQRTNEKLQQRITELEDEKGQWQLQQMDIDSKSDSDDNANANKKKSTIETIKLLEQEKQAQAAEIESLQARLSHLEQQQQKQHTQERVVIARVESELTGIQLEEQLEEQKAEIMTLQQQLAEKTTQCNELQKETENLKHKKQTLEKKLEHYINEHIELLDKVEKLSKSSSSAESIEIVDRLTQQEHAEMAEFNKQLERSQSQEHQSNHSHTQHVDELTQTEMGYELNDSLIKLREESSELMNKVAMFTTERREVLEKMEQIKSENHALRTNIQALNEEKQEMNEKILKAAQKSAKLEEELEQVNKEKQQLSTQIAESSSQRSQLSGELTSMQKSSEIVAALDNNEGCANLFEKCEKSLSKLDSELEAYKRANDKNAKFNASKKLAKEAKNAYIQMSELLQKVKEASTAVETVTVVETVVAVTAPNGKALAEYEQLTAQNRELKTTVDELRNKVQELEDNSMHETLSDLVEIKPSESVVKKVDDQQDNKKLTETLLKLQTFETECLELKNTVDNLRSQLSKVNMANEVKNGEITRLESELNELRKISNDFEKLSKDKELSYEHQAEQFTRLRKELEGKCEVYQGELEILQTLVTEQKQQLIEAFKEHEHEMNLKMLDLQQRDEQITTLRSELSELRQTSRAAGAELSDNLEKECEKLREALRINKALTAEQINELANKQETIDTLNQQLIEVYKTMEENTNKVIEKEDEIADLETTLASNTAELERLRKDNEEQKSVVDKLLNELHSQRENKQHILQLEQAKLELEQTNKELEKRSKEQLEKMKKYAANLKKRATQCQELEAKLKEYEPKASDGELQQEFTANVVLLNERISDHEMKIRTQEAQLTEIQEALQTKTIELLESMENNQKLQHDLSEIKHELVQRDEDVVQLKNALAASQEQTTAIANDWGDTTTEFENNKKIEELNEELVKVQNDLMVVREQLLTKEQAILELTESLKAEQSTKQQIEEQLQAKSLKFEKSKAVIKERNNQIQKLQLQLKDLQEKLATQPEELPIETVRVATVTASPIQPTQPALFASETVPKKEHDTLKAAFEALKTEYAHEKSTFEKTIERLETLHDGIQAKLQEDMAYIETLEQDNARFKEKICKLEECVASFEERRASMERRVHILDAQMNERADEYVKAEDELIYRLNMLSEHDEVIAQRLLQSQESKAELQERLDQLQRKHADLSTLYTKLEKEHKHFQEQTENQTDSEVQTLKQQFDLSQTELQRQRAHYDAKLAAKVTELDELENELSEQLARNNDEKRALQEDLEKSRDKCTTLKDEIMRLNESLNAAELAKQESERELTWLRMQNENAEQQEYEMQSLRMQSMQDKTELDNLRQQIETLATNHQAELEALRLQSVHDRTELENQRQQLETSNSNHQAEIDALRLQIAELDSLRMQVGQNQTDDQVFIESENKRLADLLQERDTIIADYQRQNMQLAAAAAASPPVHNITRNTPQQPPDLFASLGAESGEMSASSHLTLEQQLHEKTNLIASLQRDLESLHATNTELQMELFEKNQQIEAMNAQHSTSSNSVNTIGALNRPQSSGASHDIIPAPPMFFATSQMAPSPFDEIVQRRYEQPNLALAPVAVPNPIAAAFEQPTIEDLQRNVSDLEKYNQELEHKLATRNNTEDDLRQRLRQSEQQAAHLTEQLQLTSRRFEELQQQQNAFQTHVGQLEALLKARDEQLEVISSNPTAQQLEIRVTELETTLKARDEQLKQTTANTAEAQMSAWHIAELEQRVLDLEQLLKTLEAEKLQLKQQLEEEQKLKATAQDLEAQILPTPTNAENEFQKNVAPSLDMFFGNNTSSAVDFEDVIKPPTLPEISTEPVHEDLIVPEKAYVCYPEGDSASSTMFDASSGWVGDDAHWGATEAAAEEKHFAQNQILMRKTSLLSNEQQLELDLQAANERIKELEATFANEETQKQKLQEKLAKTMKIVSKYKTQNEQLKKKEQSEQSSAGFFDDLDVAIQDELKSQVSRLEAVVEEQRKLQQEAVHEKEKLLKRIDVLEAGNERMAEMKERQDMDMEMYKRRIQDLQQQLNKLDDWGTGAAETATTKPNVDTQSKTSQSNEDQKEFEARVKSLLAEVEDLKGDKQELQALLDEERANVARTEQNLKSQLEIVQQKQAALLEANSGLQQELKTLQQDLNAALIENEKLRLEITKANSTENTLENKEMNETKAKLESAHSELEALKEKCLNLTEKLGVEQDLKKVLEAQNLKLQDEIEALKMTNATLNANNSTGNTTTDNAAALEELIVQLQEKDTEILHLKQRVEDLMREDQTEKLVLEILTKNQEIHMLKMQVKHLEDDKHELEHNLSLQITKEMQQQKQEATIAATTPSPSEEALEKIKMLEKQNKELQNEKRQMEEELQVLNSHVMGSLDLEDKLKAAALDLDMRNIEIKELRQTLESLKATATTTTTAQQSQTQTSTDVDVTALNARWESLVEQRCNEIAQMWRAHLEQRENEFQNIEQRLKTEIEILQQKMATLPTQTTTTMTTMSSQPPPQRSISIDDTSAAGSASSTPVSTVSATTSAESSSADGTPLRIINEADADEIIAKMQTALENQEIEIVSLKEQLAIRSAEYARLAAQYDPFKLQSGTTVGQLDASPRSGGDNNASTVPKSELDLALYMLHQRDMRCEEMTMELVALMEERDILQLKLSNTLRQVETIKMQTNYLEPSPSNTEIVSSTATPTVANLSGTDSPARAITTSTTTTADDSADELHHKLSQLQTVNHSKDKLIKEERERRNRQMERIQQDVAKMPPAAVSELIGADISQTSQTPSSALLNWLWGNKPPTTGDNQGPAMN